MPVHKAERKDWMFTLLVNPNIEPKVQFITGHTGTPYKRGVIGFVGINKEREYIEPENCQDRGFEVHFYWHSPSRTWEVVGQRLPQMYMAKNQEHADKYFQTDTVFDANLTQGQGDVLLSFVQWIETLTKQPNEPEPELDDSIPVDQRSLMFSS